MSRRDKFRDHGGGSTSKSLLPTETKDKVTPFPPWYFHYPQESRTKDVGKVYRGNKSGYRRTKNCILQDPSGTW